LFSQAQHLEHAAKERRSSRRKSTRSYLVEEQYAGIDFGEEASTSAGRSRNDDEDDDDGFVPEQHQGEQEENLDEDEVMEDENDDGDGDEDDAASDLDDLLDDESIMEVDSDLEASAGAQGGISTAAALGLTRPPKPGRSSRRKGVASKPQTDTFKSRMRARGVDDAARSFGQELRLKDAYGPTDQDLKPILLTRDKWMKQHTLPSRAEGSLRRSYYIDKELTERETRQTREWYAHSGSESFRKGQTTKVLTEKQAALYLVNPGPALLNVLMGPIPAPTVYSLKKGSCMSTVEPFPSTGDRSGWLLNLGSRIQDAQWAPDEENDTQYLAVAVEQKSKKHQPKPMENPRAPAFTAQPAFSTSIQIWAFSATNKGELDQKQRPRLDLVICTDWGAPKQLRWSPIACASSADVSSGEQTKKHIGLLAGIWSDGKVRVLDVSLQWPIKSPPQTQYVHYTRAAFEVSIPDTVPSCLSWLSATSFAVGTAAGTLAIWTLTRPGTLPSAEHNQEHHHNPRPWLYKQVATTYITALDSGYPSRPNYVSIATADGLNMVIDVRSPGLDMCYALRGRIFPFTQSWYEFTQSFLLPDEAYLLRSNTIRRYYRNISVMRTEAQIVCSATSPVHPTILVGDASGMVVASNAILKVLHAKEVPWQQTWFAHEWRPPVDQLLLKVKSNQGNGQATDEGPSADPAATETVPPEVLSQPLARFSEGFKVQQATLHHKNLGNNKDGSEFFRHIAIYEESSCVTALSWNPNLKYGTWAVAGMGDGLLRVEDLGL
jgi:transcription factor C subunit 6